MQKRILKLISYFILSIVLISCFSKRDYDLVVVNNSNFTFDKMVVGCDKSPVELSVLAGDTSPQFSYTIKSPILNAFAEPSICITVSEYSDSTETYKNNIGGSFTESQFSEKAINYIVVVYDSTKLSKFRIKIE